MKLFCNNFSHLALFIRCLLIAVLAMIYGCGTDTDIAVVDFSKRLIIDKADNDAPEYPALRVAVAAMVSPEETFINYRQLLDYIGEQIGQQAQLIQRKTYAEVNELLGRGEIDLAFICSGPYVTGQELYGFEAIAIPEVRGKNQYRSYLIVNKESPYQSLEDLKNQKFAFTDPESNTGKLVPTYWLKKRRESPETFFRKVIYTYSHDNSIMAVAKNMVDGAAVHEQIWEYFNIRDPFYTSKTRVIMKSEPFGNPPIVSSSRMPEYLKEQVRQLLFSMHLSPDGKQILNRLMIDRFIKPSLKLYAPIVKMNQTIAQSMEKPHDKKADQS